MYCSAVAVVFHGGERLRKPPVPFAQCQWNSAFNSPAGQAPATITVASHQRRSRLGGFDSIHK